MDQKIAEQWVAALRSGDYTQGTGQLRSAANEFCCLGVLCNLHAQAHPDIAAQQSSTRSYLTEPSVLPGLVRVWAGMHKDNGGLKTDELLIFSVNKYGCLAEANDYGASFDEIADYIEKNYKDL